MIGQAYLRHTLAIAKAQGLPVMLANEEAVRNQSKEVKTEVEGQIWTQNTFSYQAKCLSWLRRDYSALSGSEQAQFMSLIENTGCERIFG